MIKGILKDKKKYLTLMVVPHTSDKIYTLKVTAGVYIFGIFMLILLTITSVLLFTQNAILHTQVSGYNNTYKQLNDNIAARDNKILDLENEINVQKSQIDSINDNLNEMNELAASIRAFSSSSSRGSLPSRGDTSSNPDNTYSRSNPDITISDLKNRSDELKAEFLSLSGVVDDIKNYIASKPSLWPTNAKRVTSTFGYRIDPVTKAKGDLHTGIDIASNYGAPVYAAGKGTVTFAGYKSGYGYTVEISHGYGMTSLYGHNSKLLVKKGQTVKRGDLIANVGSSGKSTGAHLHFETAMNGKRVDPYVFLNK